MRRYGEVGEEREGGGIERLEKRERVYQEDQERRDEGKGGWRCGGERVDRG